MKRIITTLVLTLLATLAAAEPPQRIVTLSPHLAELVCAAGACTRLVAVSAWSDYPEPVKKLPQIGDGFSVNYEALLALHPDLVLAWDGGTPTTAIARIRDLQLRVEPLRIEGLAGVADALEQLGRWLGSEDTANTAARSYRERLAALRLRWKNASPLRVVFQIGSSPAYSVNAASPISDAMALCGGVNVFASLPTLAAPVGAEAMLAAQPQVVLYGGDENDRSLHDYWARLPGAPAQKLGTIYAVNDDWLGRATPRLLDGVQQVCERLDAARARIAAAH